MTPTIQSVSGFAIDFTKPTRNIYHYFDIGHGLSNVCRYGGQCDQFYSVAEHSVTMSYLVPSEYALEALFHDATEAYLGDMPTPLKMLCPDYQRIEYGFDLSIRMLYGLPLAMSDVVKAADKAALQYEKPQVQTRPSKVWDHIHFPPLTVHSPVVKFLGPVTSRSCDGRDAWLNRFNELWHKPAPTALPVAQRHAVEVELALLERT